MLENLLRSIGLTVAIIAGVALHDICRERTELCQRYLSQQKTVTEGTRKKAGIFANENSRYSKDEKYGAVVCILAGSYFALRKKKENN